jgi:L-alanine-DL-glutamate epimerase-like enolase superfamily enzyme
MEIAGLRFEELSGVHPDVDPEAFYEERLARPVDLYEEFRRETATDWHVSEDDEDAGAVGGTADEEGFRVTQTFLFVETDTEHEGVAGPIDRTHARIAAEFAGLLRGRDPRRTEKLWDLMYRQAVHGRKGRTMQAISAVDCALWDLRGKAVGEPLYRLLGGPVREELPCYASMLGHSVEPDRVRERAAEFRERGFPAQKWFFRHGRSGGAEGKRANLALAEAAREATGEDYDLMFDAWMSWGREYARDLIPDLAAYDPRWLEEPVRPDDLGGYAALRDAAPFPVAGGEHEYTRWGAHDLLQRGCVDVLQPDTYWAGGITEMQHVASLASVHDVPLVPHGHSVPTNAHLVAAHPASVTPRVEYLVKWNRLLQFFLADPVHPEDGHVTPPDGPGVGIELDDAKADRRAELDL